MKLTINLKENISNVVLENALANRHKALSVHLLIT